MPTSPTRRRIEIPAEVYDMLDREARWLHIPVANLATMLIREGIERLSDGRGSLAAQVYAGGSPLGTPAEMQRKAASDG